MTKYFLGSVGKAEAFRVDSNGNRVLAFVSKTLTDSGLNISTTKDDIRAGQGAPIQFSFYHDPSVEITLTDVLWKKEYLTAQLGAEFVSGSEDYVTDEIVFTDGVATITNGKIKQCPVPCADGSKYLVWGAVKGTDDFYTISYDGTTVLTLDASAPVRTGTYCVRYLGAATTQQAEINSLIIPDELYLIITAPIFAGDACAASRGKAAGHITFEIPRFQLNGTQEFAMNMSSNQTMSLSGIALAATSDDCEAMGGKLLRVIEVIDNHTWKDDVTSLIVDASSAEAGDTPSVYGELKDYHLKAISNSDLTFTPALTDGKFADDTEYNIVLNGTSIATSVTIGTPE